jgi:hypothetical protein
MTHPTTTSHNYMRKLARMMASGAVDFDVSLVHFDHAKWCDFDPATGSGFCNCDPAVIVCDLAPQRQN